MPGQCWTKNEQAKKRYDSRRAAKQARRHFVNTLDSDPGGPYRCAECGYFHLGHYPSSPAVRAMFRDRHRGERSGV